MLDKIATLLHRRHLLALPIVSLATLVGPPLATADPGPASFSYTGAEQTYTVPARVTGVAITAIGGPGATGFTSEFYAGGPGAFGARVTGEVAVTPGETLYVEVGGAGGQLGAGGFNGGGSATPPGDRPGAGGGGGGASDVRTCSRIAVTCPDGSPDTLHSRLLVAGGGGGGSAVSFNAPGVSGGAGGTTDGQPGSYGMGPVSSKGSGGGGGTLSAGGAGGLSGADGVVPCDNSDEPGATGSFGTGGDAGAGDPYGGGGGGGYWGGGGGGNGCTYQTESSSGGGGGGGSSYGPTGLVVTVDTSGVPSVTITPSTFAPTPPPSPPTVPPGPPTPSPSAPMPPAVPADPSGTVTPPLSGTGTTPQAPTAQQTQPAQIVLSCRTALVGVKTVRDHEQRVARVPRRVCRSGSVSGPVTFAATGSWIQAAITRGGAVYATGDGVARANGRWQLTLYPARAIPAGHYTLTVRSRTQRNAKKTQTARTTITVTSPGNGEV